MATSTYTRILAIVGPTAVGKTALSIELAQRFDGEIVSADSRQIYRSMDIGTAKATPAEQAAAPHHLIDVVDPDEELTLAHYRQLATEAIAAIAARGKLPILVGGTGLYVRALLEAGPFRGAAAARRAAAHRTRRARRARRPAPTPGCGGSVAAARYRRPQRAPHDPPSRSMGPPVSDLVAAAKPATVPRLTIGLTCRGPTSTVIDDRVDRMIAARLVASQTLGARL